MAGRIGGRLGGILGLCILIEDHQEAIEYDLICRGLRLPQLGSRKLSWRDLLIIVRFSGPDTALFRSKHGEQWSITDQLLAAVANALHGANWQRGGGKGTRPKPIIPPSEKVSQTFGRDPIPIRHFDEWWDKN